MNSLTTPGQGGRSCASGARQEVIASSYYIRSFVANSTFVAIYALFESLIEGFQQKLSCFGTIIHLTQPNGLMYD